MTAAGPNSASQDASQEIIRIECELARLRAIRLSRSEGAAVWMRVVSVGLVLALLLAAAGGIWLLQAQQSGRLRPAKTPPPAAPRH